MTNAASADYKLLKPRIKRIERMVTQKDIQEAIEMAKAFGYYDDLRFKIALRKMKKKVKKQ